MSKKKKIIFILLPLFIILSISVIKFWAQLACNEYTTVFTENFDTIDYKDIVYSSVSSWPPGPVTLSYLGGKLDMSQPAGVGAKIYVCDKGDFDGDGLDDLIALDISEAGGRQYELLLVRNKFSDLNGDGADDDGKIFIIDRLESYEWNLTGQVPAISVGDYNGDGLLDFFFVKNFQDAAVYDAFLAVMYINVGTKTDPNFNRYYTAPNLDFTTKFKNKSIYIRWAGDHIDSADIDKDGDTDVLFVAENKIWVVRNPGPANFTLDKWQITELKYNQRPGFPTGDLMGGSAIEAADFDRDGDLDIVAGSVEWVDYLAYYSNDGTGNYTFYKIPITDTSCIGTVAICAEDFNNDGRLDLMCSNDRWRTNNLAKLYMFRNDGNNPPGSGIPVKFSFICLNSCVAINPSANDSDMVVAVDYDRDGDFDVITCDANQSGDYFLFTNKLAPVYSLFGEARSTNLMVGLDENLYAVTKAKVKTLTQGFFGTSSSGLKITYYLSNNGLDWELFATYEGSDIHSYSDLPVHKFEHFGSKLFWKAVMNAPEDPMTEYTGASYDTPYIAQIDFEFIHVERREYSRTSAAATFVDYNNVLRKCIIASTFYYPGWQGHLRAYDVSAITVENTVYSVLRTVTRSDPSSPSGRSILIEGVEILWDAGQLLNARTASTRAIYTAVPSGGKLTRIDFSASNVDTLAPILQDVNNDDAGLINFVRGEGRDWKLGDSNHSAPVVVGPPQEEALLMGTGYPEFKNYWKDRRKVIYLGANDGMLHCFDIVTGEELWAFIPYNLLPKLRNICNIIPETGQRTFNRGTYVDASPTVADVYIDINGDAVKEWITILVCGQGPGNGSSLAGGLNYYFALDVSDPQNPYPLWEFTESAMGETWSVPQIGKVVKQGSPAWVAFVGSGYDNDINNILGNKFYAVDLETGTAFWTFTDSGVDTIATRGFTWDIQNAFAGSPSIVDLDQNGRVDLVYFNDLDGRVWRANVSEDFADASSWPVTKIYEDSNNFPILGKPAIWIKGGGFVRLFFGTGGDDKAPSDVTYSFVALIDKATPEVEWYLGDPSVLNLPTERDAGDLEVGEKVWADPVTANLICYFSTLKGNIENVDPCENILGVGKLYARYVESIAGSIVGSTALFVEPGVAVESLQLEIKTRAAVTLGERQTTGGGSRKREIYIQEYDSTIQRMEQAILSSLKVKSWREIFKIMK